MKEQRKKGERRKKERRKLLTEKQFRKLIEEGKVSKYDERVWKKRRKTKKMGKNITVLATIAAEKANQGATPRAMPSGMPPLSSLMGETVTSRNFAMSPKSQVIVCVQMLSNPVTYSLPYVITRRTHCQPLGSVLSLYSI